MNDPSSQTRSRSTELTGGEGFTYEDTVVAYYLAALLHESTAAQTCGNVVRVAVQQSSHEEPLDDLIVDAESSAGASRLSLQVKRQITISKSNDDFREVMANAVRTRAKPDFRVGVDRYGFVARRVGDDRLNSLGRIISKAQASPAGGQFAARFVPGGEASQEDIALKCELAELLQPADPEAEVDFYRHFVAVRMDGLEPGGDRYAELCNRLGQLSAEGQDGSLFAKLLCRIVREGEGKGAVWTRPSLLAQLRHLIRLRVAPAYFDDIRVLTELAKNYASEIRHDIAGLAIDRGRLVDKAAEAANVYKLSNISGLPGCGKSAVLRHLVERRLANGPTLFLKSDRLEGASWQSFSTSIGLRHRFPGELLAEIGATGTAVLFIDGIDRVRPDHRGVITDLLRAIEADAALMHWHVVASSRDQGLEPFRQWVPASFYQATGIGDVSIEPLDDAEAEQLAIGKPYLQRLLFGSPSVQGIARRPFFAAVLADQFAAAPADEAPPQTEVELIAAWWRAGGYNAEQSAVLTRQRALIDFAEKGASSLGKTVRVRELQGATIEQLSELKRDHIIEVVEEGSVFSFAHDIFFEWGFFRVLIDRNETWTQAIAAAGEPPLLARVVGLLSQNAYEAGDGWAAGFQLLARQQLRPQWLRAWLLGAPASPKFAEKLEPFENLLFANNGEWLKKFLVWFQAERTIPNPLVLMNSKSGLGGATLIRVADQLGWPSDLELWNRVLSWILARHSMFSVSVIPNVVELFEVFQNMLGDIANETSKLVVEVIEVWLLELEKTGSELQARSPKPDKWDGLQYGARGPLVSALRQLLLRSGRSYPDAACRVIERAIAANSRRTGLFDAIVAYSPILAQICPEKLAELVRAEVLELLPLEEKEKEEHEQEAYYARLAAIRAKPKNKRSAGEKRMLGAPVSIHGLKRYGFDDIGINRHHSSFYPPTPLHQPFASLFQSAPEIARKLVRDLTNHATRGWRQIHEINAPGGGTPLPLDVDFPWGRQQFWGDMSTYSWFLGELGPQPVEAALLALTYWAHKSLDAGRNVDDVIKEVVEGHENWTVLGLASSLALEKAEASEPTLALVVSQRLWHADIARQVQNPGQPITVFGMNPRDRMTQDKREALDYLLKRKFRQLSVRDLVPLFALGTNEAMKERVKTALQNFPNDLPYMYEEEKAIAARTARLRESASIWAGLGNAANYTWQTVADQPETVVARFEPPEPPSAELEQKRIDNENALRDFSAIRWAQESFERGAPHAQFKLSSVVSFARSRDSENLMDEVADGAGVATQTCVAAVAAMATYFSMDSREKDWGWSVLARIVATSDRNDSFGLARNPYDPRHYLIAALFHALETEVAPPWASECLIKLGTGTNFDIAQSALIALMRLVNDPNLAWNGAVLASDLFSSHAPAIDEKSHRDTSLQESYLAQMRENALGRLTDSSPVALGAPPPAWIKGPRPRRGSWDQGAEAEEWRYPDFDFHPGFAAPLLKEFPVESWVADAERRELLLKYLERLIQWTVDRLFPSWEEEHERNGRSTDQFEWLSALAGVLVRVSAFLPSEAVIDRFIQPFSRHQHEDAIHFIADLASSLVCRQVYDAPFVTDDALVLLQFCLNRMLEEHVFKPDSYRAGEINGYALPDMIRALLLVSVDGAAGAVRFANGDWNDLPRLMPIVDALMSRAGWSRFVMDTYLTLCERARKALTTDTFARHITASTQALSNDTWIGTTIPARIAGVVHGLAEFNHPLSADQARGLLIILDQLVDMGDRRAAALQSSEHFRSVQIS